MMFQLWAACLVKYFFQAYFLIRLEPKTHGHLHRQKERQTILHPFDVYTQSCLRSNKSLTICFICHIHISTNTTAILEIFESFKDIYFAPWIPLADLSH